MFIHALAAPCVALPCPGSLIQKTGKSSLACDQRTGFTWRLVGVIIHFAESFIARMQRAHDLSAALATHIHLLIIVKTWPFYSLTQLGYTAWPAEIQSPGASQPVSEARLSAARQATHWRPERWRGGSIFGFHPLKGRSSEEDHKFRRNVICLRPTLPLFWCLPIRSC